MSTKICDQINGSLPNTIITINHFSGKDEKSDCKNDKHDICEKCSNNNCLNKLENSYFNKKTNSCECLEGYEKVNNKCKGMFIFKKELIYNIVQLCDLKNEDNKFIKCKKN